jgi:hypothetical protein
MAVEHIDIVATGRRIRRGFGLLALLCLIGAPAFFWLCYLALDAVNVGQPVFLGADPHTWVLASVVGMLACVIGFGWAFLHWVIMVVASWCFVLWES